MASGEDLLSIESFQFVHQHILKSGRQSYEVPKHLSPEEAEEFLQQARDADPLNLPLEALPAEAAKNWVIKFEGDATPVSGANGEEASNRQVLHLRSRLWKGAHNVYDPRSKTWAFFYCGYGLNDQQQIYPLKFYPIQDTPKEQKEHPEPNGELKEEEEEKKEEEEAEAEVDENGEKEGEETEEAEDQVVNENLDD